MRSQQPVVIKMTPVLMLVAAFVMVVQSYPSSTPFEAHEPHPTAFFLPASYDRIPEYQQRSASEEDDTITLSPDLMAPMETLGWNPDNDPNFYYEVPVILSQAQQSTNKFPKKFDKELHTKEKPYARKPKHEILLVPIDEQQFIDKQNRMEKVRNNYEKSKVRTEIKEQQRQRSDAQGRSEVSY